MGIDAKFLTKVLANQAQQCIERILHPNQVIYSQPILYKGANAFQGQRGFPWAIKELAQKSHKRLNH